MPTVGTLIRDPMVALRQLRQAPVVSTVALLSLALGNGSPIGPP